MEREDRSRVGDGVANSCGPKISIITVVRNARRTIESTILSVLNQTFKDFEYILVDGASNDGTLELIEKHGHRISYWKSEADGGIYDAMNKGIEVATGEWLIFLGADDILYDEHVLSRISVFLQDGFDFICGNVVYPSGKKFVPSLSYKTLMVNTLHHQGVFYSRNLFGSFRYGCSYGPVADYELNFILYIKKARGVFVDIPIALCGENGASQTSSELLNYKYMYYIRRGYVLPSSNIIYFAIGMANLIRRFLLKRMSR